MLLAAHGQAFGMRQVVSRTNLGAKVAAASGTSALSTPLRSSREILETAPMFGQKSQQERQSFESDQQPNNNRETNWLKNKYVQAGGWGFGAWALYDQYQMDCKNEKEFEEEMAIMFKETKDLAVEDPELYKACLRIKNDMGITQDVYFRVTDPVYDYADMGKDQITGGFLPVYKKYEHAIVPSVNILLLCYDYKNRSKPLVIKTIVHELEHCRQRNKYFGSYHTEKTFENNDLARKEGDAIRGEVGADAAAADYMHCSACLDELSLQARHDHDPKDTEYGYFTTIKGYFSKKDYLLYRDRAKKNCALCRAHKGPLGFMKQPSINEPWMNFLPRAA